MNCSQIPDRRKSENFVFVHARGVIYPKASRPSKQNKNNLSIENLITSLSSIIFSKFKYTQNC